ncbi:UDP-N-acetylglucosamine 2-epimerase [Leifsonia xyli]|uniref:UDP-N-acetylglucosamine 2-epimerase n=1 Tax=Leifsonia xyli TaxID=1575 RepID=UPI002109113A|nr:UDP-N-acetylglucosamine 2-epimerase [Leifsonia xyli]
MQPPQVSLVQPPVRSRGDQIGSMTIALTHEFMIDHPDAVIVQGDTNIVNAAVQAASYLGIPVIHVEAGLRSRDRDMPEESNRIIADALADRHCAPTLLNVQNFQNEGIPSTNISLTGNTVVETVMHNPRPLSGNQGPPGCRFTARQLRARDHSPAGEH